MKSFFKKLFLLNLVLFFSIPSILFAQLGGNYTFEAIPGSFTSFSAIQSSTGITFSGIISPQDPTLSPQDFNILIECIDPAFAGQNVPSALTIDTQGGNVIDSSGNFSFVAPGTLDQNTTYNCIVLAYTQLPNPDGTGVQNYGFNSTFQVNSSSSNNSNNNNNNQGNESTTGSQGNESTTGSQGNESTTGSEGNESTTGSGGNITETINNPLNVSDITDFMAKLLEIFIKVSIPILVIFIVYSGFRFLIARGNEAELEKAKKNFLWVVIGTAIVLGSWVIVTIIRGTVEQISLIHDIIRAIV